MKIDHCSINDATTHAQAPYATDSIVQRTTPFIFATTFGLLLIPLQDLPLQGGLLALAILALTSVVGFAMLVGRFPGLPSWVPRLAPILFLLAVALLREATGGVLSGYGALLFLAPFWVALYDTRKQVIVVMIAMFLVQAGQGLNEANWEDITALRRALLSAVIIGMISLAVQRNVSNLRAAEVSLAEEAAERALANERLAESNDRLERSNRELEQFAYVSSHDLQEPLRMIRSFSQLFLKRHGDQIDADGTELLGFVADGAARAQDLVNDLLDYSRVETTGRTFDTVALDESLDRALQTLRMRIEENEAVIERPERLPTVSGDASQLDRVFVNLIGNALKYRAADRAPRVRIAAERDGRQWRIIVVDNGIGFDNEHAERIFLMFQRLHGRSEYEGTGIGLAICSRIVERHGGEIHATSVPEGGATFTFTIEADTA